MAATIECNSATTSRCRPAEMSASIRSSRTRRRNSSSRSARLQAGKVGKVRQRRSPPEGECIGQKAAGRQLFEILRVDRGSQRVGGAAACDRPLAEFPAQPGDIRLDNLAGGRRWVVRPESVDNGVDGYGGADAHGEYRQKRPLLRAAEIDQPPGDRA